MKIKNLLFTVLVSIFLLIPINASASNVNYSAVNSVNILATNVATTDAMGLCDDPRFVKLIKYGCTIVNLLMYAGAIALVIGCVMALIKEMTSDKAEVEKAIKTMGSKIILAVILFLLPSLVNWIFFTDNFITQKNNFLSKCITNMNDTTFLNSSVNNSGNTNNSNNTSNTSNTGNTSGGSYGSHESSSGYSHGGGGNRR